MRRLLLGSLGLSFAFFATRAGAQDVQWRSRTALSQRPALSAPAVSLGRPVALDAGPAPERPLTPVSYSQPVVRGQSPEAAPAPTLGQPVVATVSYAADPIVQAQAPPPADPYNCGVVANPFVPPAGAADPSLFGQQWLGCTSCSTRKLFESDHCFDNFISPVTNPFLFEDPRSLTEIRPIFMLQATPHGNWLFGNGSVGFYGMQARLAITERLSFVINKLGGVWQDPKNGLGLVESNSGFSELWLGPKYTLIRNETSGTLLATGLTFQIPSGPSGVEQNTGHLSLTPYLSFAQNFARSSYGSFNFMNTTGYTFSVDKERTDYFYSSFHLDFDVANAHKIYPLIEMNWYQYTRSGTSHPFGFEGRDLFNFGSTNVSGQGTLTIAPGVRYKFTEHAQIGTAFEFPLVSPRDLVDFRWTVDFILRF